MSDDEYAIKLHGVLQGVTIERHPVKRERAQRRARRGWIDSRENLINGDQCAGGEGAFAMAYSGFGQDQVEGVSSEPGLGCEPFEVVIGCFPEVAKGVSCAALKAVSGEFEERFKLRCRDP